MVDYVGVTSSGGGIDKIKKDLLTLMKTDVLVGIPEDKSLREETTKANNAQLLYIHTNGSDLQGIPKRPVIEPAIKASEDKINKILGEAAKLSLEGNISQAKLKLKEAGLLGANASRAWFTDPRNNWPPNSLTTIKRKGSSKPLIDTGQMRKAITFVVREK